MANKAQKRKQKRKQNRQKKKSQSRNRVATAAPQQTGSVSSASSRQRERLAQQSPKAWPSETPEDAAVFDDAVLGTLAVELVDQVIAVRKSLQSACNSRSEEALKAFSSIPRSSPLSQWRLFIRGLVSWLADETAAADETWKRLDPERRPGRIATAMMSALCPDLEKATRNPPEVQASEERPRVNWGKWFSWPRNKFEEQAPEEQAPDEQAPDEPAPDEPFADWLNQLDDPLLYHAKLLRRARFDRVALRIAESSVKTAEESKELIMGPRKIRWLKRFAAEYQDTEPQLVAALEQVALGRAFVQDFSNIFDEIVKAFEGPRHDPRNLLLSFYYYWRFDDDEFSERQAEAYLTRYLEKDLPANQELSEPLRKAIASQIHLTEAKIRIRQSSQDMMSFMSFMREPEDRKSIKKHLQAAVKAYPAHRRAYRTHVDWIESKLENERLTKTERAPLERELTAVMRDWSRGLPEDADPRLWLVDHLLENEKMDEAKPHVEWLAAARLDDPRVRATPWKWQLLEAMRLCRRKAWTTEVPAKLEQADALWPAWLSKGWLPYLKAALTLRSGQSAWFEEQRQQICQEAGITRDSLTDACMMLGAAQRMRVPNADLKPLRVPIDQAVKNLGSLASEELLSACQFFWDLHRVGLVYPAYRMHGGKFVKELFDRMKKSPNLARNNLDDPQVHDAVFLCSEHRFFMNAYDFKLPDWYEKLVADGHPIFVAAKANAFLKLPYFRSARDSNKLGQVLRDESLSQRDPYYRYWFNALAEELEERISRESANRFDFNPFREMFGGFGDNEDDDHDFDEDLGFDPNCQCAECKSARRAYEASR